MLKLKCSGEGTSLTNFQNVKNDPMGPNFFELYDMYTIMTHVFSKLQVTKNCSVIMEPFSIPKVAKNGQKEPDFEKSEIKLFVLDPCISKDSFRQGQSIQMFISHFELNQCQNNAK